MSTISRAMAVGYVVSTAFWFSPAGATDAQAAGPGDEAMTCEQIAAELVPYVQQVAPNIQALGATQQQMYAQGRQQLQQRKMEHEALTPLATASALDSTGAAKQAYQLALMAQMAKEKAENEALANSPLAKQNKAQSDQLAAQGREMQSNARLQRLMELGQAKHCDKR